MLGPVIPSFISDLDCVLRAGLEATRLHLPARRQLVRGHDRMQFGQFSPQSFVLTQPSYPQHSLPHSRNIISAGCSPSRPAAVQGPLTSPPSSPPAHTHFRCFQFPPLFMTLSHQSGSCGKTDGFRKLGKFQEGYLQRGTAYRRGRAAGVREPEGECKPPGPAQGGQLPPVGLEGSRRGGHQQMKKESHQGDACVLESSDVRSSDSLSKAP